MRRGSWNGGGWESSESRAESSEQAFMASFEAEPLFVSQVNFLAGDMISIFPILSPGKGKLNFQPLEEETRLT